MSDPTTSTLIQAHDLQALLHSGVPLQVWDCRFDLAQPGWGQAEHAQGHVPGAAYRHLDHDLSGAKDGRNGRHPLPSREAWCRRLGEWGLTPAHRVVVMDHGPGMYAARAWWMLRWAGHPAVQVLDGGWAAWQAAGGEVETGAPASPAAMPPATPYPEDQPSLARLALADEVLAGLGRDVVVDARAPERFRGEVEPLDPVAGHIPGACNLPFTQQLDAQGRWRDAQALRALWHEAVPATRQDASQLVLQCGSGVTACHLALGLHLAGMAAPRLYAGSWSEWCADPARPVETGPARGR